MKTFTIYLKSIAARACAALFWLAIWQIAAHAINKTILLPTPLAVFKTLITLIVTVEFWQSVFFSLICIIAGYIAGMILGIIMAGLTTKFAIARIIFDPLASVIKATPVASFIILALVWIKPQHLSIFATFLMVLPIIWVNVAAGINSADPRLIEMGQIFKFGHLKQLRLITVPAVMPYLLSASRSALGFAWKAGVAAEVLGVVRGSVGGQLQQAKVYLEMPSLFAWTMVVILMSILLEKLLIVLTKKTSDKIIGIR